MPDHPNQSTSTTPDSFTRNFVENEDEMADVQDNDPLLSTYAEP